jgi:hypothetical protein
MIIIACEIMRQSNEVRSISAVCVLDSLPRDHGTSAPAPTIMEGVDADSKLACFTNVLTLYIHRILKQKYPLVYNRTPHPQWSSGYDFRLSLIPTSRGRPGFDSLLRRNSEMTSSLISCLPALAHQRRSLFSFSFP